MSLRKTAIGDCVGRTVEAVVVSLRDDDPRPRHQVFFVFSDGTHYEFYGDNINCSGGLCPKGGLKGVLDYVQKFPGGTTICYTRNPAEEKVQ